MESLSYTVYNPKNNDRYWLFLANFDEESIDYLAQLGGYDISLYNKGFHRNKKAAKNLQISEKVLIFAT